MLAVATLLVGAVGPVVAQPASPTPTAQRSDTASTERIDGNTVIVRSRYLSNESVALVTLRSERAQSVTLYDAGQFQQGGKPETRTVALDKGQTATIEIPVTEVDGQVGVGISTRDTLIYGEIIKASGGGGLGILEAVSPLQAWFGGVGVAFIWMIIAGISVMRRESGRPEVAT